MRDAAKYFAGHPRPESPQGHDGHCPALRRAEVRSFPPDKFEDHFETALRELLGKKEAGEKIVPAEAPRPAKVVNLMDALKRSLDAERKSARRTATGRSAASREQRQETAWAGFTQPPEGGLSALLGHCRNQLGSREREVLRWQTSPPR